MTVARIRTGGWRRVRSFANLGSETRGFARDSFVLSMANGLTIVGLMAQISLITHALGLEQFGVFTLVVSAVTIVQRLFDLQVGHTAIAYAADTVGSSARRTAGIFQFAYLVNFVAGSASFFVVVALAPLVGPRLVGSQGALLGILYSITLVASTVHMTSLSLLRMFDRYGLIFWYTLTREAMRVALLVGALVLFHSVRSVVVALVAVDIVMAIVGVLLATKLFRRQAGVALFAPALGLIADLRRPMLRMMLQTNFVSFTRIASAQGPAIVVGALSGPLAAGELKVGLAVAAGIAKLGDPLWTAAIPRFARLWSARRMAEIRRLVVQTTTMASVGMGVAALVAIVFRRPLLEVFGGSEATAAAAVLVFGVLGQALNAAVFWNAPLLIACKKAYVVAWHNGISTVVLVPLLVVLTHRWGAAGAAFALLIYNVQLNVGLTLSAVRRVFAVSEAEAAPSPRVDAVTAKPDRLGA